MKANTLRRKIRYLLFGNLSKEGKGNVSSADQRSRPCYKALFSNKNKREAKKACPQSKNCCKRKKEVY